MSADTARFEEYFEMYLKDGQDMLYSVAFLNMLYFPGAFFFHVRNLPSQDNFIKAFYMLGGFLHTLMWFFRYLSFGSNGKIAFSIW